MAALTRSRSSLHSPTCCWGPSEAVPGVLNIGGVGLVISLDFAETQLYPRTGMDIFFSVVSPPSTRQTETLGQQKAPSLSYQALMIKVLGFPGLSRVLERRKLQWGEGEKKAGWPTGQRPALRPQASTLVQAAHWSLFNKVFRSNFLRVEH